MLFPFPNMFVRLLHIVVCHCTYSSPFNLGEIWYSSAAIVHVFGARRHILLSLGMEWLDHEVNVHSALVDPTEQLSTVVVQPAVTGIFSFPMSISTLAIFTVALVGALWCSLGVQFAHRSVSL